MSTINHIFIRKNPDAKRIYDYLLEHGPTTSLQIGRDLPDISPQSRSRISERLSNLGLIAGKRVTVGRMATTEWRVIR